MNADKSRMKGKNRVSKRFRKVGPGETAQNVLLCPTFVFPVHRVPRRFTW